MSKVALGYNPLYPKPTVYRWKGQNCAEPSNYRPISLTSVCLKVMEHIIIAS